MPLSPKNAKVQFRKLHCFFHRLGLTFYEDIGNEEPLVPNNQNQGLGGRNR
jgi:hypothetical protein